MLLSLQATSARENLLATAAGLRFQLVFLRMLLQATFARVIRLAASGAQDFCWFYRWSLQATFARENLLAGGAEVSIGWFPRRSLQATFAFLFFFPLNAVFWCGSALRKTRKTLLLFREDGRLEETLTQKEIELRIQQG